MLSFIVALIVLVILLIAAFLLVHRFHTKLEGEKYKSIIDALTLLIGFMTLIVSAVSIAVMISQERTQKQLSAVQMKEHQPVFQVSYNYDYHDDFLYTIEYEIENVGNVTQLPPVVSEKSFIKVDYYKALESTKTAYIPLNDYFNASFYTDNLSGVIRSSGYSDNNNYDFCQFYFSALEYGQNNDESVLPEIVHYYIIVYNDIYHEEHSVVIKDNSIVTMESYQKVVDNSEHYFGSRQFSVHQLSLDDVMDTIINTPEPKSNKKKGRHR